MLHAESAEWSTAEHTTKLNSPREMLMLSPTTPWLLKSGSLRAGWVGAGGAERGPAGTHAARRASGAFEKSWRDCARGVEGEKPSTCNVGCILLKGGIQLANTGHCNRFWGRTFGRAPSPFKLEKKQPFKLVKVPS